MNENKQNRQDENWRKRNHKKDRSQRVSEQDAKHRHREEHRREAEAKRFHAVDYTACAGFRVPRWVRQPMPRPSRGAKV